jgi:high affinity Mn2+ porin
MHGFQLGGQMTATWQSSLPFRSPYQGPNSFRSGPEAETSHVYTLYTGWRLGDVEAYVNPELAAGNGLGRALGLAGYPNGDVIRNPSLGSTPNWARYFVRWTIPLTSKRELSEAAPNAIAGSRPVERVVLTGGKMAVNDIFDTNRYANNTHAQFMNWALINDAAYDYAADTRGYTGGVALEWIHPDWALRVGSFRMPVVANGIALAGDLVHNRGDQAEVEVHAPLLAGCEPLVARVLGFRNLGHMGDYRASVARAQQDGTVPDIAQTATPGAVKWGMGLNLEQPLADHGDTGLFARLGFNDGRKEDFCYTEADAHLSVGGQLSGAHWGRPQDRVGVALVVDNLSAAHRAYLEAGGQGFLLGDGRLHYGPEQVLESYYAFQLNKPFAITADVQVINNPGFNHDRGPALIPSVRFHVDF